MQHIKRPNIKDWFVPWDMLMSRLIFMSSADSQSESDTDRVTSDPFPFVKIALLE